MYCQGVRMVGEEGQKIIQVAKGFADTIGRDTSGESLSVETICFFRFSGGQMIWG